MKTEYITLKETILTNNCPECYSQETLLLAFKQEKSFSRFMTKIKKGFLSTMHCKKCDTEIYPGMWTEDIERVYNYHRKTVQPKSSSLKFTGLFYGVFFLAVIIVAFGIVYITNPALINM